MLCVWKLHVLIVFLLIAFLVEKFRPDFLFEIAIDVFISNIFIKLWKIIHIHKCLTRNRPKYLQWNLALEKLEGFFLLNYAILNFGKCLNYWISNLQRDDIFFLSKLNSKDLLKYFFLLPYGIAGSGISNIPYDVFPKKYFPSRKSRTSYFCFFRISSLRFKLVS